MPASSFKALESLEIQSLALVAENHPQSAVATLNHMVRQAGNNQSGGS